MRQTPLVLAMDSASDESDDDQHDMADMADMADGYDDQDDSDDYDMTEPVEIESNGNAPSVDRGDDEPRLVDRDEPRPRPRLTTNPPDRAYTRRYLGTCRALSCLLLWSSGYQPELDCCVQRFSTLSALPASRSRSCSGPWASYLPRQPRSLWLQAHARRCGPLSAG